LLLWLHILPNEENAMKKSKVRFHVFVFALLAALLFTSAAGAAPKEGPAVSLSVAQNEFEATQDVLVTVTISNPTKHTVRVLKWFTPVEGVEEPLFVVTRDGEPVPYTGAHYKRPAATGKDYVSLKAGESLTHTVNLGDIYDLSQSGQYEVLYAVAAFNLLDEKANAFQFRDSLTSEAVSMKVEGREAKGKPTPPPPPPPGGNTFNACTTAQQTALVNARNQAKTYASESRNYLNSHSSGTQRYTEWFGVFSTARYGTVTNHFAAISDAMTNAGIAFDCKCKQNYYAYVYPNRPYNIYLCKVFWTAPLAGTDSQAGTLIHEMSHFDVVAATDDVVYGQAGARNLADTDPDLAVTNADNHEYFAENTPALP
jgi:peptidyl-Lys metalloendopeptidase